MDGGLSGIDAAALTALLAAEPAIPPLDMHVCLMLAEAALGGALAGVRARQDAHPPTPGEPA